MSDKEEFLESENARLRSLLKQAGLDAAASDIGERLQRLLLSELHHRIKNMLSMVQSIVTQTLRSGHPSTEATEEAINRRIAALARTHDIIMSNAGDGAQLRGLVDEILAPFGASRFKINIPSAEVASRAAVSLALVLNELATNAVKHGALSVPGGVASIDGRKDDAANEVVIRWMEAGGPVVQPPSKLGFGTQLVQVALPSTPILEFRPSGVFCELRVPLPLDGGHVSN